MTPYFYEHLPAFEKQEQAMRFYADEMINAIDLTAETARLSTVKFDAAPLQRAAKKVEVAAPQPVLSPAGQTLQKAESLFTARNEAPGNLQDAKNLFIKALEQKGDDAEHAQAWYGMARIAMVERKGSTALQLFEKTLESSPDDFVRGWSDVQLGGIYRSQQDFAKATQYFKDALAVSGASDKAKETAQSELNAISKIQEKQTP
jgi:tetratricopeptide (TPR) repeat protein